MFIENWEYWKKRQIRLHQGEIGGLKERCRKIEQESVRTNRKWQNVHEQLQKIPELERELRASNQRIAALERKLTERDNSPSSPRIQPQQLVEKLAIMEKRLKEAGISTEQEGQHELVREIHRIQAWIYSLNGGWSANSPPEIGRIRFLLWKIVVWNYRHSTRRYRPKFRESNPLGLNPVQFNPLGLNQFQSNPVQVNWINFSQRESIQSQSNGFQSNWINANWFQFHWIGSNFIQSRWIQCRII